MGSDAMADVNHSARHHYVNICIHTLSPVSDVMAGVNHSARHHYVNICIHTLSPVHGV